MTEIVETLHSELLAVAGVASAKVDVGNGATPAGVKVSLAPDADARRVSVEVQRVLAAHGVRSRFSSEEDEPPDAPPSVPDLVTPIPQPQETVSAPPMPVVPMPPSSVPSVRPPIPEVTSVSVDEQWDDLTVSVVLADGRRASRVVGFGTDEFDAAIIAAVAEAVGESVTKVAMEWIEVDDSSVVTVVIKRSDGSLAAGAGVVRFGRAFAVGTATRSALQA